MTENTERESKSTERSRRITILLTVLAIALTAVLAARHFYRSAYSASDLRIAPDELEYALCARRVATLGHFDWVVDGVSVPPFSTPWFSLLLAPVYLVAPGEIGNGIYVVFAFAIAGLIVMSRIGALMAGPVGGALVVIAALALLPYPNSAALIMTDGPAMTLGLLGLWLFLRWAPSPVRVRQSLIAGLLIAGAFALRSVYLSMLVPFAWRALRAPDRRTAHLAALLSPLVVVVALNAYYNQTTFGDWRRNGYQYWCAVPYDYPELLLSLSNIKTNLQELDVPLLSKTLALGAVGILALVVRRPPRWKELLGFSAVVALPISALYLLYFYSSPRFHDYLFALCSVIGGSGLASLLPVRWREQPLAGVAAVSALAIASIAMKPFDMEEPLRRETADHIQATTPDDAVIIAEIEPPYLETLAPPGSHRTYLAASRVVEFASKVLVKSRIERELAAPRDAYDHAARGLLAHGGRWAIAHTADEMHDQIDEWVRAGRPVFLETRYLTDLDGLKRTLGTTLRLEHPRARLTRVVAK